MVDNNPTTSFNTMATACYGSPCYKLLSLTIPETPTLCEELPAERIILAIPLLELMK
jgi:hypothetical protein